MPTHPPSLPSTSAPLAGASQARRWAGWAILIAVGLASVLGGGLFAQRAQSGAARTALVVAGLQADAQALATEALLASRGTPGAIDNLAQWRGKIAVAMTLLSKGGYAAPGDPAPVLALEGRPSMPLASVRQAWEGLDAQVRKLEENAGSLRAAAQAEQELAASLDKTERALQNIDRIPALTSAGWGAALQPARVALSRPEMKTMRVIFAPLPGAQTLQASWGQQFAQTAEQLRGLGAAASKDPTLSGSHRNQVLALAEGAAGLARATATLSQSLPARLSAQQLQTPIQASAQAFQTPLAQVGTQVMAMVSSRPLGSYVAWLGAAMALVGLAGLVRAAMALGQDHWAASQDSRSVHGLGDAVDRLARQLKKMLDRPGGAVPHERLEEDPGSPAFSVVSLLNRLLESHQRHENDLTMASQGVLDAVGQATSPHQRATVDLGRIQEEAQQSSGLARTIAQELARLAQEETGAEAQRLVEMVAHVEQVMQESVFKTESMRDRTQHTAKRIKRVAEGAQGIAIASDLIDEISRQVKVLATNAAIEAASSGEGGRRFAVLAKEIERLSHNAHKAAADIGKAVTSIQSDAQETVVAMENNTSEMVESSQLTGRASASIRDIEKAAARGASQRKGWLDNVEKQALASARLSKKCDEVAGMSQTASQESEAVGVAIGRAREAGRRMRQERPSPTEPF